MEDFICSYCVLVWLIGIIIWFWSCHRSNKMGLKFIKGQLFVATIWAFHFWVKFMLILVIYKSFVLEQFTYIFTLIKWAFKCEVENLFFKQWVDGMSFCIFLNFYLSLTIFTLHLKRITLWVRWTKHFVAIFTMQKNWKLANSTTIWANEIFH